jgi:hypothetical protein
MKILSAALSDGVLDLAACSSQTKDSTTSAIGDGVTSESPGAFVPVNCQHVVINFTRELSGHV